MCNQTIDQLTKSMNSVKTKRARFLVKNNSYFCLKVLPVVKRNTQQTAQKKQSASLNRNGSILLSDNSHLNMTNATQTEFLNLLIIDLLHSRFLPTSFLQSLFSKHLENVITN